MEMFADTLMQRFLQTKYTIKTKRLTLFCNKLLMEEEEITLLCFRKIETHNCTRY